MFAGKKSAQIREILISESAWEEMTCLFAPSLKVDVSHKEVGSKSLQEWYEACRTPILINERVTLNTIGGYEISGKGWSSYSTAIQARELAKLYKKHRTKIFSANI